jgi:hypothetical protein
MLATRRADTNQSVDVVSSLCERLQFITTLLIFKGVRREPSEINFLELLGPLDSRGFTIRS